MHFLGHFPQTRMRRARGAPWLRRLVEENTLRPQDFVLPLFVKEGEGQSEPIPTMPGIERLTIDRLLEKIEEAKKLGILAVALFPVVDPSRKSPGGEEALNPENLICRAIRAVKKAHPNIGVIADVALDPYTTHGHDGLWHPDPLHPDGGIVLNDESVERLCQQALVQAEAGCDIVAPSDMMDGRVGAIRKALDAKGFERVCILSYAVKYASAFYGPFRDAIGSRAHLGQGHKRGYQMNPANSDEALREAALDVAEGADFLMVKPALPYLDVIARVKSAFGLPLFAYQVSGEYAMLKMAHGAIDWEAALLESLVAMKRAGADVIISYGAIEAIRLLEAAGI
ncbi:MAG: porphobilinogen synthase [Sandaracinaceae bacterium]|nr:porphobilinogen synthase [Sandaracinaceae bacterium]MDW8247384.1 porphobilinogen synthase [Sandaracinaceae bacterium]